MKRINLKDIEGIGFAYDGCHKIYIIEDSEDIYNAIKVGYNIYQMYELPSIWENSCSLRFISNWKLTNQYVKQFEDVEIEEDF